MPPWLAALRKSKEVLSTAAAFDHATLEAALRTAAAELG